MSEQLYGAWVSPIDAKDLVVGAAGLSEVVTDGGDVWFNESRPEEGGRVAIMRWRDGAISEVTTAGADVSTRVHEYGVVYLRSRDAQRWETRAGERSCGRGW